MITNISLTNFRGFEEEVSVRIRPITVLIGRNSAGKSSLIKFLQMLRQTLESQRDEFFVTDGRYVQLGNWSSLKNSRCKKRAFKFSIDIETSDIPTADIQELWQSASKKGIVTTTGDQIQLSMAFTQSPVHQVSPTAWFNINGQVSYTKEFKFGTHTVTGCVDETEIFSKRATNLESTSFLRFSRRTDSLNDLIESVAAEQFLDRLRYEFTSIRHLSPVREESLRTIQAGSPPPHDVGDRGEYAIPHLVRIFSDDTQKEQANLISRFASLVADVDEISFKSQIANLSTQIKARNKRTQATSYLADFGFGVSQCLPIFIQGAMHNPGQLLLVEQPEAQLHPTAQLELGSFFAALWHERKVPTLLETHSANVVLRLRRLVKEGQIKPEEITLAYFTVDEREGRSVVTVKNLDIQADGSLEKGLPMEFFGADVIEAITMGA
ncbi:MAG: AAA family ATPase [Anaerolinea sp.]|nr:AAA family ATPase [Anaerolinea sp.]